MLCCLLCLLSVVLITLSSCDFENIFSAHFEEHKHTYSNIWSSDDNYHWHGATCGHNTQVSDKAAHTWDDGMLQNTEKCGDGAIVVFTCTTCGKTKQEIPAKCEYEEKEVKLATCTQVGYITYICKVCSHTCIADFVNAIGHNYEDSATIQHASCTLEGIYEQTCANCKDVKRYSQNALGHSIDEAEFTNKSGMGDCPFRF